MQLKTFLAPAILMSLFMLGCQQQTPPTSSIAGDDKQASAPTSPGQALEHAPPAAGVVPAGNDQTALPAESPVTAPAADSMPTQPGVPAQEK